MKVAIGRKLGMTQLFNELGEQIPATMIRIEPAVISQIRKKKKDGYRAIQVAVGGGKKQGKERLYKKEFRIWTDQSEADKFKVGDKLAGQLLAPTQSVNVTGFSKGHGFQGVIKRHNFSRGPMSHGSRHHRSTGAIGQCEMPSRVFKGKKMPGRMGGGRVTIKNLKFVKQDQDIIYLKGGVPGSNGNYLALRGVEEAVEDES
jgi:large subunit ribosomal protein L3